MTVLLLLLLLLSLLLLLAGEARFRVTRRLSLVEKRRERDSISNRKDRNLAVRHWRGGGNSVEFSVLGRKYERSIEGSHKTRIISTDVDKCSLAETVLIHLSRRVLDPRGEEGVIFYLSLTNDDIHQWRSVLERNQGILKEIVPFPLHLEQLI